MPAISEFFGITIYMYYNEEHFKPHIHAYYGENKATFDFDGDIIVGTFPKKQARLVSGWIALNEDKLKLLWDLVRANEPTFDIKGLE